MRCVLGLLVARLPLAAPLPGYEGLDELLPAALEHARQRAEVLRTGRDDAAQQGQLTAAFLRRLTDDCGGAVSPA